MIVRIVLRSFGLSFVLFWDFTHRIILASYRRFGTTCLVVEDETDSLSRNVSTNYRSTLLKIPKERGSHLRSGESQKSHFEGCDVYRCRGGQGFEWVLFTQNESVGIR